MLNKRITSIIILLALLSVNTPASAFAKQGVALGNSSTGFTFADLGEKDITVKVISEQVTVNFPVPQGQQINHATLKLHLQHSPDLLPDLSDIVIALNNEPVTNIILTPENATDNTMEIEMPVQVLKTGHNELLLRFSMRLDQNGCRDVNSSKLWTTVFADSAVSLDAQQIPESNDLSQFPMPFSTFAALPHSPQTSIILPSHPTPAELSAAAQIAATLGQTSNWKTPPLSVYTSDQLDQNRLASDALIVVDTHHRASLTASAAPGLTALASPYNPNQLMLIVSGADDAELLRSVSMLTTLSARAILKGNHLNPIAVTTQPIPEEPTRASFADLGIVTKRTRGIGLHDLYYPIDIPYDWKTTSDASVEIHFAHGRALTSASLMTALINGFEISNTRLDSRNDDEGRLVIQLSPRQIHPGRNWLHIVFNLHMPRENCKYRYFEEAWAEISADQSIINLAHVLSEAPLELHYMPSHLVIPHDLSLDLFVLSANPSSIDLTAMARLAAKLGTYATADTIRIRATTADQFTPQDTQTNVIAIGVPETNALIKQYDAKLPQPLGLVNGKIVPSSGRALLPEEQNDQAAYIEVLTSPWSVRDSLVVIGARTPDQLSAAINALPASSDKRIKELGNVAVVTNDKMTGLSLGSLAGIQLSASARTVIAIILIGSFILIGIVGVYINRRRRIQAQEASNEEE